MCVFHPVNIIPSLHAFKPAILLASFLFFVLIICTLSGFSCTYVGDCDVMTPCMSPSEVKMTNTISPISSDHSFACVCVCVCVCACVPIYASVWAGPTCLYQCTHT